MSTRRDSCRARIRTADALAAGRQHQTAEAQFVVEPPQREVGQTLGSDGAGRARDCSLPLLGNGGIGVLLKA